MKHRKTNEGKVLVRCGHCGLEHETPANEITEPIDAYGDFIDIYFKDQEYSRLSKRAEKLEAKGQFTELAQVYTILADIATINKDQFLKEYEANKGSEDLANAEKWKDAEEKYNNTAKQLREKLASNEIQDTPAEKQVFDDTDDEMRAGEDTQIVPTQKPKRKTDLNDVLDDTGFLEF